MDIQELKQFESVYQPSKEVAFCWLRKQYVQLSTEENHTEIVDHANDSLRIWQAAKANAIPDGFVVVPRKSIEHWYLDEGECLWMGEPDNWLCDMDVGDVQEVKHKEYIVTENNTLYATKVWDAENQDVSSWEFFSSKDDAEKAAEYCKAMIEARESANE